MMRRQISCFNLCVMSMLQQPLMKSGLNLSMFIDALLCCLSKAFSNVQRNLRAAQRTSNGVVISSEIEKENQLGLV